MDSQLYQLSRRFPDDYLGKKRDAITKAMKETADIYKNRKTVSLKDASNIVGLKAVGGINIKK